LPFLRLIGKDRIYDKYKNPDFSNHKKQRLLINLTATTYNIMYIPKLDNDYKKTFISLLKIPIFDENRAEAIPAGCGVEREGTFHGSLKQTFT
jgi:hypothetical protein